MFCVLFSSFSSATEKKHPAYNDVCHSLSKVPQGTALEHREALGKGLRQETKAALGVLPLHHTQ